MIKKEDLVKIGRFAKPHGVKGEIALVTSFDFFDEMEEEPYVVCELEGIFVPFFVEEYRYKTDTTMLLKLENLNSDEAVKPFTNCEVYIPLEKVEDAGVDSGISWDHFVGYQVHDKERGYLGVVEDVDDSTLNVLFKVAYQSKELLIPVVEDFIVGMDHDEKKLFLSVPHGLFDL